ncbi:pre-rRNA-processing protein ESF2 [Coccidioides immitis RS]|uniref:Pre-rRNA-processing protein ESF2 n=1 Tax=Coccidioides immitis (strain RS) TaxID=246410 RepID=ESF2_COCIM|nr:pre-rRNA-processing protein ESF2 [Coccidioides immitis RS]Q1DJR2.1 RecName: Full=Pre-rRNA-processing protein ESF2; AltName: Full=18S rRNA factor 2 [Coccidioides immitis RS]EAS28247.3 pre-rRNA-processing protein ESF2 [Coccidioides immitis RS]TPX20893.1 RNA-binding ATPase activator esf2 [Coccidioides immitis]
MTTRKRTDFWDIPSDEEDNDVGYDSEAAQESKGRSSVSKSTTAPSRLRRPSKRRKLSITEHGGGSDNGSGSESEDEGIDTESDEPEQEEQIEEGEQEDEEAESPIEPTSKSTPAATATTTTSSTDIDTTTSTASNPKLKPKKNKTGVIYFSSLPPYLKPFALKSLLIARGFGPITKIFLTPSVQSSSAGKRSNKRRMYSDGWVEFASKRTAKICAETLNATIVGGKKGGWYHDDVWNMKYLRGFKWADLMEQVQRERKETEARRRVEDAKARKEEKVFLAGVEKGKVFEGIRKKREEKEKKLRAGGEGDMGDGGKVSLDKPRRVFRQNEVRDREKDGVRKERKVDEDVQRVLAKIF